MMLLSKLAPEKKNLPVTAKIVHLVCLAVRAQTRSSVPGGLITTTMHTYVCFSFDCLPSLHNNEGEQMIKRYPLTDRMQKTSHSDYPSPPLWNCL